LGRRQLLEVACPHDANAVRNSQSLLLVMGNKHRGGADRELDASDLITQLYPHRGVKGGQRLVQ